MSSVYRPVPFNFCDLESKAQDYLSGIRQEAVQLTVQARDEVAKLRSEAQQEMSLAQTETARVATESAALAERQAKVDFDLETRRKQVETAAQKSGYDTGYKTGFEEGRNKGYSDGEVEALTNYSDKVRTEAELQLAGRIDTLMPALQAAVKHLETAKQSFLLHWEQSALQVATAIAARAITRQLPEMIDIPLKLLRESLELAVGCSQMKIRLNPTDYETLRPQIDMLVGELSGTATTEIISDPKISPGGNIIETSLGIIDQRIESRLQRIEMELV